MHKIGDLVIYSSHGICRIDDITNKIFSGIERSYYVLQPIENKQHLTINVPVEQNKQNIFKLMDKEDAEEIFGILEQDGFEWIERSQDRAKAYNKVVNSGDRKEIAMIFHTLTRKKIEAEEQGKKLYEYDGKLLSTIKDILYKELAIALESTYEEVEEEINQLFK